MGHETREMRRERETRDMRQGARDMRDKAGDKCTHTLGGHMLMKHTTHLYISTYDISNMTYRKGERERSIHMLV